MPAQRQDIDALLQRLQRHIKSFRDWPGKPPRILWVPRPPGYVEQLLTLKLTTTQALDHLIELVVEDYSSGPSQEHDKQGQELWIFGKKIEKRDAYIKFAFRQDAQGDYLLIWSFHRTPSPLKNPLRNQGGRP